MSIRCRLGFHDWVEPVMHRNVRVSACGRCESAIKILDAGSIPVAMAFNGHDIREILNKSNPTKED